MGRYRRAAVTTAASPATAATTATAAGDVGARKEKEENYFKVRQILLALILEQTFNFKPIPKRNKSFSRMLKKAGGQTIVIIHVPLPDSISGSDHIM